MRKKTTTKIYSYHKLYSYLAVGKKIKTTEDIALFMGVTKNKVANLIHNARRKGKLMIWTIYDGEWGYAVKNITAEDAQFYANRVAKYGLGIFQNSAPTLQQSFLIGGEKIKQIIKQTTIEITNTIEQPQSENNNRFLPDFTLVNQRGRLVNKEGTTEVIKPTITVLPRLSRKH